MIKILINNNCMGRFSDDYKLRIADGFKLDTSTENMLITYAENSSWEAAYTEFIQQRQADYIRVFENTSKTTGVTSVNGLQGDIFLLAGRGIAIEANDTTFKINNTMYNTENSKIISDLVYEDAKQVALERIFRYQMCLYHGINRLIHRSLTTNPTCLGIYLKYMAARAKWNNYVYTSCMNQNVISSGDSIFITLGFNNTTDVDETVIMEATITASESHKNLIWYGIFLEEMSPATTTNLNANAPTGTDKVADTVFDYTITRDGFYYQLSDSYYSSKDVVTSKPPSNEDEDEEEIADTRVWLPDPTGVGGSYVTRLTAPTDITNPNNCIWSAYGGAWTQGKIQQQCTLKSLTSCKYVYTIAKHPGVSGYTKRSVAIPFDITITYTWSIGTVERTYKNVLCYMQEYDTQDGAQNAGNKKRYILVANEDMGKLEDIEE